MLARLFLAHQVAILCHSTYAYLFYHGKVYKRLAKFGIWDLPKNPNSRYCPIWALIDVRCLNRGPILERSANV